MCRYSPWSAAPTTTPDDAAAGTTPTAPMPAAAAPSRDAVISRKSRTQHQCNRRWHHHARPSQHAALIKPASCTEVPLVSRVRRTVRRSLYHCCP